MASDKPLPDKKQRIMQAFEALFRARQFHEITLDEVARHADVGKGTIYLYFTDKDDLFFQTAVAGFDEMCEVLHQDTQEGRAFQEGLLRTCEQISGFFRERRPLFRLILAQGERALGRGGSLRQRWLKRRERLTAAVATVIGRGVATGEIRADLPVPVMAEYLLGMLRTRALDLDAVPEAQRSLAGLVDLFVRGAADPRRPSHN
jgi:AcrR family transcriptional regulator